MLICFRTFNRTPSQPSTRAVTHEVYLGRQRSRHRQPPAHDQRPDDGPLRLRSFRGYQSRKPLTKGTRLHNDVTQRCITTLVTNSLTAHAGSWRLSALETTAGQGAVGKIHTLHAGVWVAHARRGHALALSKRATHFLAGCAVAQVRCHLMRLGA